YSFRDVDCNAATYYFSICCIISTIVDSSVHRLRHNTLSVIELRRENRRKERIIGIDTVVDFLKVRTSASRGDESPPVNSPTRERGTRRSNRQATPKVIHRSVSLSV